MLGLACARGDTFFWSLFTDKFGSHSFLLSTVLISVVWGCEMQIPDYHDQGNPNTPYMWNALPAFGFLLPSPMWNLRQGTCIAS